MAQPALYRECPQAFDDVVSQQHVVFPLRQAVISGDVGHAYLFRTREPARHRLRNFC